MALDVWLVLPIPGGANSSRRHVVAFDWNGEFEFLSPFWPTVTTRGAVDLYGDAVFRGNELNGLREALLRAREAATAQPKKWNEYTGKQIKPKGAAIYAEVTRSAVQQSLSALLFAVDQAVTHKGAIEFLGD